MDTRSRRTELKAFLRARRAAVAPEAVGIERGGRRLTPGLRREEVAALANVGVVWYTWLEQGRDIHPSADTVGRIARALRLSPADARYLHLMAGVTEPPRPTSGIELSPDIAAVLKSYSAPAVVLDPVFEVLAHNRAADLVYGFNKLEGPFAKNQLWNLFMNPARRQLYVDYDTDAPSFVALFRLNAAAHLDDPRYGQIVSALTELSPTFATMWNERRAATLRPRTVRLRHPDHGLLTVSSTRFAIEGAPGAMMIFLAPADDETGAAFARMSRSAR